MLKKYLFSAFVAVILTGSLAYGQASGYSFNAFSGSFTPVSGGTRLTAVEADDATANVTLPFNFLYEGVSYSSVFVNSNGTVNFVSTPPSGFDSRNNNMATPGANMAPSLCPLWDDLDGGGPATAKFEWVMTGTSPSRVITFEWLNWEWDWGSTQEVVSFQVKLYETSNEIDFVYRQESATPTTPGASIGLIGASSFLSLQNSGTSPTVSSLVAQNNITSRPATGQVYRFSPPACLGPNSLAQDSATTTSIDLSWMTGGASDWQIEYGTQGFLIGTGTQVTVATNSNYSLTSLTQATCYDFYVRDSCGPGNVSGWVGPVTMCTAWPTPYLETYDSNIPLNMGGSTQASYAYENGWRSEGLSGNYNFLTHNGTTTSSPGGPGQDHTTGSGVYMYTEASTGFSGNQAQLLSPYIDLSGVANPTIRLWYHRQGTNLAPHSIEVDTGTGWIILDDTTMVGTTHNGPASTDPWSEVLVNIGSYQGAIARFRVFSVSAGCCSDPAVDDFEIFDLLDDDAKMVGITDPVDGGCEGDYSISIDVQNNGNDTITTLDAAYSINGGTAVKETFNVTILPFNIANLTFTQQASFPAGITNITTWTELAADSALSNDTIIDSVDMAPVVDTNIYCESFENGTGGWLPSGVNSTWARGVPGASYISSAASGNNAYVTNLTGNYNNSEESYLQSPCLDYSNYDKDPTLEFSHIYNTESGFDNTYMEISFNGGLTWSKLGSSGTGTNWYNNASGQYWEGTHSAGSGNWQRARQVLTGAAGQSEVKIRFVLSTDGSVPREGVGVDSIVIVTPPADMFPDTISTCGDPNFELDASGPYDTAATYRWSTGDSTAVIGNLTTGSYTVTITDKKLGISTSETVEVIVTNPPTVTFATTVDTIDANGLPVVIYLDPKLSDSYQYEWQSNGNTTTFPFFVADPALLNPGTNNIVVTVTDEFGCSTTASHQIFVSTFVGINTLGDSKVGFYPNPTSDQFTVEMSGKEALGSITMTIMDYRGTVVYQSVVADQTGNLRETIDVSGFASGMYIIQLQTKEAVLNSKLVIE